MYKANCNCNDSSTSMLYVSSKICLFIGSSDDANETTVGAGHLQVHADRTVNYSLRGCNW